jgi:DNA topoisomerase-1
MKKALIIVESPAKIKTLKKFLGSNYLFESSLGHIRDLPKKGFGIDIQHDFEPQYAVLEEKKDVISKLKKAAKEADIVYLSPDPDREGEAIAWHISSILPPGTKAKRVTFNAITKEAVLEALQHPRDIDQALVDAQQARRMLDRIVGYKISPILTRRVQGSRDGGLSAGRVQSVALKLVVDREREIEAFVPVEYWNIFANMQGKKGDKTFSATLFSVDGKKIEKEAIEGKEVTLIPNEKTAQDLVRELKTATYKVDSVEKKEKRRNPVAPFITSTLQQEASRHFGFSATRTMSIAQTLYEGVDFGSEGAEGLITYMRTDSVRIAPEAIDAVRGFIVKAFGKDYLPDQARFYSTKKSAQDAHEAIRPTNLSRPPEKLQKYLTPDQLKLYTLIWRRFIASQMNPAVYDTVTCDIATNKNMMLRASGSIIKFPGFLAVYEEKQDKENDHHKEEDESRILPPLVEGQTLQLLGLTPEQSFTKPPPRFTEASLVKELEKSGIGRPSTYATIMQKIQNRDYTVKERGTLKPTELGRVIAKMLEDNFRLIMDIGFTAMMEDNLELVAENKIPWKDLISEFWKEFIPTVETAEKEAFVPKLLTDINCPDCSHKLQKIWSRNKYFYGCSNYPECKYTAPIEALEFKKEDYAPGFNWDQSCPKCSSPMKLRFGRFGPFLGCSKYPECKGIVNIPKKDDIPPEQMPACPAIGCDGKLAQRRSRFGKPFYSCSNYPDCDVIVSNLEDLAEKYVNHPKTPYVKKESKWGKKKGKKGEKEEKGAKKPKKKSTRVQPTYELSKELQAVVDAKELSRPEATKKLWDYIKANKLQDPKNKRLIVPDAKLSKVIGKSAIDMMQLAKALSKHFIK